MKLSLCLLVKNELNGCKIDIPNLPRQEFDEIFAIDGGSTDGTIEYLKSQGIEVFRQKKVGLNAAYVDANNLATGDSIIVFFPKGTISPNELLKFRPLFQKGFQLIVASRQIAGSVNEEDGQLLRPRKWAVFGLALLASIIWRKEGYWIRDVLHGFKGWDRDAFKKMKILDFGLSIDVEMVIRSYKLKMRRVEFPTSEKVRSHGETNFKLLPTGIKLLNYLWYEIRRKS